jgi:glycosyltransferase involved in cell wall biosynthesis
MSPGNPLVSVIVTTRNSERTIDACLASIRSQVYQPIELIVIDHESTDRTVQIARDYTQMVDSFGPERSAQRNRGAYLAHGEYLLFIDSDMKLSPGVVADCVSTIRANGAPGVVIPEISFGEGFLAKCRSLERSCYLGDDTIEGARFFTQNAFQTTGGFDETLTGPEDWDLSIRVAGTARLPRTTRQIWHNEGRIKLGAVMAKKRYYAASWAAYMRKHPRHALGQANLIFRPAFRRHWRRLARHPVLTFGFLSLKGLETAAAVWGAMEAQLASPSVARSTRS